MGLETLLDITIHSTRRKTSIGAGPGVLDDLVFRKLFGLTDGVADGQANRLWHDSRTLSLSTSETLDVYSGGLLDAFGDELILDSLAFCWLHNLPTSADVVEIARPGSNGVPLFSVGGSIFVPPGGFAFLYAGPDSTRWATDATSDGIDITNGSAGTSFYDIILIGRQ